MQRTPQPHHPSAPLTLHQVHALELEGDVVAAGEDVERPAGLREQVQVQLQPHPAAAACSAPLPVRTPAPRSCSSTGPSRGAEPPPRGCPTALPARPHRGPLPKGPAAGSGRAPARGEGRAVPGGFEEQGRCWFEVPSGLCQLVFELWLGFTIAQRA